MRALPRSLFLFAAAVTLVFSVGTERARGQAGGEAKRVPIPTCDGVELAATYYPTTGKKDACVLLLHNFDAKKGGNSHQDGWDELALELQKEGYAVLSFDFRGFGESKTVEPAFWKNPINAGLRGARLPRPPESIDQKDFPGPYYTNLVNDVAAAKAYLDRQNDLNKVNSSNVILIGAGEGATVGAMWLTAEWKRRKVKAFPFTNEDNLDQPEGKDVACAVWLSISPTLAGMTVPLTRWSSEVGRERKVPMLFMYGANDPQGSSVAFANLKMIVPTFKLGQKPDVKGLELTRDWAIKGTKLAGSALLNKNLETAKIIKFYLDDNLNKRGSREPKKREADKWVYIWDLGMGKQKLVAKDQNEELGKPVPPSVVGLLR